MPDLTIQPTTKFIKAGVAAVILAIVAIEVLYLFVGNYPAGWWLALPVLLLAWPLLRLLRRRLTRTTITGDRLRYETGVATKSTRNIQLSKIQDVRVEQRLLQRVFDVGDLSIETAGESSRLTIHNVDQPQALADELMNRVDQGRPTA
ncbi:MAG TPA: PH domain-containing protein [Bryobacteraceae bacterium]|nr:PH domain-containing protein [Bryobacteraceae bacterium]